MNFPVLPPEINSVLMYSGAGSSPLLAAAAAWDGLAEELGSAAVSFGQVTSGLTAGVPGRWSAVLVGPWWPAPSAALRAAAQHWATWAMQKQELARNLISQHDLLSRNQGRTAEDLIGRYLRGAKSEVTKAEKYEIKKGAFNTAADAIDYLRSRLTGIAGEGNKEIDDVLARRSPGSYGPTG